MADVLQGIVIGGAGGTIAGVTVWVVEYVHRRVVERRDRRRVYRWLEAGTADPAGPAFRSTRSIASYTNLTEDRVRYVCSTHPEIYLSTGETEDLWAVQGRGGR